MWYNLFCHSPVESAFSFLSNSRLSVRVPQDCDKPEKQQVDGSLIRGTMTKEIELSRGKVALVDDEDFAYLSQYIWNALNPVPGYYYAARTIRGGTVLMHREIKYYGKFAGDRS